MAVNELSSIGLLLVFIGFPVSCAYASPRRFDVGVGPAADGYRLLTPDMEYTDSRGFGWLGPTTLNAVRRKSTDELHRSLATAEKPFWFTTDLPEGNYRVTVELGDSNESTKTTVKAESRRLVLPGVSTEPGEHRTERFTVNIRTAGLAGGGTVDLNDRERGTLHWDSQLTLEFGDERPGVCAISIERAEDVPTVFLVGDSTVTDQPHPPWNSWGQMLTRFFGPQVAIANYAESGQKVRSFVTDRRWEKVRSQFSQGDYLFVQFGHNDMKDGTPEETGFIDGLSRFVDDAREHGVTPVLLTPPHRRQFDANGAVVDTHRDYPAAVRTIARNKAVELIDLQLKSGTLYESLGVNGSSAAFVDGTHHSDYGSYQLAYCVVEGIRESDLDLASSLRPEIGSYDPAVPTPIPAEWRMPDVTPPHHRLP